MVQPTRAFGPGGSVMLPLIKRLWQEEEGQDLAEYGLLAVLVSLGSIAAMEKLASGMGAMFTEASASIASS